MPAKKSSTVEYPEQWKAVLAQMTPEERRDFEDKSPVIQAEIMDLWIQGNADDRLDRGEKPRTAAEEAAKKREEGKRRDRAVGAIGTAIRTGASGRRNKAGGLSQGPLDAPLPPVEPRKPHPLKGTSLIDTTFAGEGVRLHVVTEDVRDIPPAVKAKAEELLRIVRRVLKADKATPEAMDAVERAYQAARGAAPPWVDTLVHNIVCAKLDSQNHRENPGVEWALDTGEVILFAMRDFYDLPDWVTPELVDHLIERCGVEGRGSAKGLLSRAGIVAHLVALVESEGRPIEVSKSARRARRRKH